MTLHCFKVTWKDKGEVSHVIHIYEEFESTMQSLAQFWAFIVKGDSYGSDIVDDLHNGPSFPRVYDSQLLDHCF